MISMDANGLAAYGLEIIDRGIRKYVKKYFRLEDEMRSRAHFDLARAIPRAILHENPQAYVITTVTNAFRQVERSALRAWKRAGGIDLQAMIDGGDEPLSREMRPDQEAIFHESCRELINSPTPVMPPRPERHAVQPEEWETFRQIVRKLPGATNREIADAVNLATGRKFNLNSVWRARRQLGV